MMRDTEDSDKTAFESARLDPALLEVLVCPVTQGPLKYDRTRGELVSHQLGRAFPVRDGVPIMLVEESRALDDDGGDSGS
jgi:uncharacterized protein YbaR (Trm112 family)